jgi:CDGSH iron-sulfur domain-containing protein 3
MPDAPPSVTVNVRPNGPLLVMGPFTLIDPTGQAVTIPAGKPTALCRCGHSTMKPYCDGSHGPKGFLACERMPQR